MSQFSIREAQITDVDDIFRMIKGVAAFEGREHEVLITTEDLEREWKNGLLHGFVAELNTGNDAGALKVKRPLVGFVMYFYTFNSRCGKTSYLEDIYVAEDWRRKGIATALMAALMKKALAEGCSYVNWKAMGWNSSAISFYLHRGARDVTEEMREFRIEKDAMEKLANTRPSN